MTQKLHDVQQLGPLVRRAIAESRPFNQSGCVDTLAFQVDASTALLITTNATADTGCEIVMFCPVEQASNAQLALAEAVASLQAGAIRFSEEYTGIGGSHAVLPLMLPPPPNLTPLGRSLIAAVGEVPTVVARLVTAVHPDTRSDVAACPELVRQGQAALLPVGDTAEMIAFCEMMRAAVQGLLQALRGEDASATLPDSYDRDMEHPVITGVQRDHFTPVSVSAEAQAIITPHHVPEFGELSFRAVVAEIGDFKAFDVAPEDIVMLRVAFELEGAVVAQAQVTCFYPVLDMLDTIAHPMDQDWYSTFADEEGEPRACARRAGWEMLAPIARVDGLFIAPMFRDEAMLAAVVQRLRALLDSCSGEPVVLTLGVNGLADDFTLSEMGPGEREWFEKAYTGALGGVRCGPVVHGCFEDGPSRTCDQHDPWYLLPPA